MHRIFITISAFLFLFPSTEKINAQEQNPGVHNILYINSYAMCYPWTDSLVSGIQKVFVQRKDVQLYIEFLDAKRFGQTQFNQQLKLFAEKYHNVKFDAVITSDNDALDFMMLYGDELAPDVPVVFCGINNPQDYDFSHTRFYGILDAVDLKTEINLITRIMPEVKKLYFITDNGTTSLLNLRYVKALEPEYSGHLQFIYIHNYSLDSLMHAVTAFEKGNAIALMNYFHDSNGNPVNPDAVYAEIAQKSPIPIFMDSETLFGKGIAGGIINNGAIHGRETANLALNFIDDPNFIPAMQVTLPRGRYFFDYKILQKFNISEKLLPAGSVIINQPEKLLGKYIKFIFMQIGIIGFLLMLLLFLYFNIKKRKKAEAEVKQKLQEIQEKNSQLNIVHKQVNEMNNELEEMNEHLSLTNEALTIAKQRSEESDKLKSAFLANMSHEIRTPLNAIIGFSALLNDSVITEDEKDEYFKIIGSNSDQLLRIIDDILDLSKIEAGQLKLYIESFHVGDFLHEIVDSFINTIPGDLQIIVTETPNTNLIMKSDRARFKQIISNLVSNAIKFTRNGVIEVGYNFDMPKEITFFVKDTGIGIEPKDLKNIFNRFWKGDLKGQKAYSGAGLGLAISRKLCEALGGKISVESEPGIGTTFFISFQDYIIKRMDADRKVTEPMIPVFNLESFTIAIEEDEKNNLYLLTRILRNLRLKVITFKTGKEIVDYFSKYGHTPVDLILMDIKMPDMDGIVASRLIREIKPKIPIIAQTAYAMAEDIEKIRSSTFDDYVSKPIKPAILIEKIRKFLNPEIA
jgi:signal transduction histidine kinase/CheY-like chemotaxis protein